MKRLTLIGILLLLVLGLAAKPARPGWVRHTQPDGSVILLQLHGDEGGHYATDTSGKVLEQDAQGYYRPSFSSEQDAARWVASVRRHKAARSLVNLRGEEEQTFRILVLLVEFNDLPFTLLNPREKFQEMLNREGYSDLGGTGSVRDYFLDNSAGEIDLSFDVYGPVKLSKNVSAYGKDVMESGVRVGDIAPELAISEACLQLDGELDFSPYDANADGVVDLVLCYYAGYDQAEGGRSETIWSHIWNVQESQYEQARSARVDNLKLGNYICTSELQGESGNVMCGIGSTCHELGHVFGLPDFYDTNGSQEGVAAGLYEFSLMGLGLYNNGTHTPPYLNMIERKLLGLVEDIPALPEGWVDICPVQNNVAFQVPTSTEGESFLYECRNGKGWDAPLPPGLLVYHVDASDHVVGGVTARELWENWELYNALNASVQHPCCYLVPSARQELVELTSIESGRIVYPGLNHVLCHEGIDWADAYTGWQVTNIAPKGECVSVFVQHDAGANINGRVVGPDGAPIPGVLLSVAGESLSATSGDDGFFRLDVPDEWAGQELRLGASKSGYRARFLEVCLAPGRMACVLITLRKEGESDQNELSKFNKNAKKGYYPSAGIGAVKYTPEELAPYAGQVLREVTFFPRVTEEFEGSVYVTVDVGNQRVLSQQVENIQVGQFLEHKVDVSAAGIVVPEGLPVFIGYGSEQGGYSFSLGTVYPVEKGNSFFSSFDLEQSHWQDLYVSRAGYYMDLMLMACVAEQDSPEALDQLGYCWIDPGKGNWKDGDVLECRLHQAVGVTLTSIRWSWDGLPLSEASVTLSTGEHKLCASLVYADGRKEQLEMPVFVR